MPIISLLKTLRVSQYDRFSHYFSLISSSLGDTAILRSPIIEWKSTMTEPGFSLSEGDTNRLLLFRIFQNKLKSHYLITLFGFYAPKSQNLMLLNSTWLLAMFYANSSVYFLQGMRTQNKHFSVLVQTFRNWNAHTNDWTLPVRIT